MKFTQVVQLKNSFHLTLNFKQGDGVLSSIFENRKKVFSHRCDIKMAIPSEFLQHQSPSVCEICPSFTEATISLGSEFDSFARAEIVLRELESVNQNMTAMVEDVQKKVEEERKRWVMSESVEDSCVIIKDREVAMDKVSYFQTKGGFFFLLKH